MTAKKKNIISDSQGIRINYNPDMPLADNGRPPQEEETFVHGHTPSRMEELTKRDRKLERGRDIVGDTSDIQSMLDRTGGYVVKQTEDLHQSSPGYETYDAETWKNLREKSHNRRTNTYYSWR